jgi:hypothetical protein
MRCRGCGGLLARSGTDETFDRRVDVAVPLMERAQRLDCLDFFCELCAYHCLPPPLLDSLKRLARLGLVKHGAEGVLSGVRRSWELAWFGVRSKGLRQRMLVILPEVGVPEPHHAQGVEPSAASSNMSSEQARSTANRYCS